MRKFQIIALVLIILLCGQMYGYAASITDDSSTMIPLSMLLAQWCKDKDMEYSEAFWITMFLSLGKEALDQASGRTFSSTHVAYNMLGMTLSWYIFNF
jgi:hypothetical protein